MSRARQICVSVAVMLSLAAIVLAILDTVSAATTIILLGIGLLVLCAGVLQK